MLLTESLAGSEICVEENLFNSYFDYNNAV